MAGMEDEMANVNSLRYSSAVFKVAQKEVWRVFDWLHHHHYRHKPPAYVGQRLRECEGGMKRIGAKERVALERQEDPATMDIQLLYRLLQHTCGLRQDGPGFDWTSPRGEEQRQSLEHRLYLIKEARNSLCHRPKQYMHLSDHQLGTLLQELQGLLCHSLQQAGQRSGRPAGEVDDAVASVRDRLDHIQATVPPSAITPQEFALFARAELQEQWEGLGTSGEWLSPPMLRWAVRAQVVTLDQLLQGPGGEDEGPPRVLAVLGEAGIGKSSLCRQMVEAWLKGEAPAVSAAAAVEVVVKVELREVLTRDLTRLILQKLLPRTCRRCHPEEVLRLLGALRVLWLLDGFEEASADARELLHFLVQWCSSSSGSHVVVVTSQPEYMEDLEAHLAPAATPCYVAHCGLTQQGLHSLLASRLQGGQGAAGERRVKQKQRWRRTSKEAGVAARCQAFLKEVEAMDPNLPRELHNPLKLVLAVQLWQEGRLREVAGASLPRLYAAIQEVLVAKLVARLRTKSTLTEAEARERVKQWVAVLCGVALAMWGRGCFVSLDEAAEQMLKDQAIKLLLPYTDCFSTFLVCRGGPGPRHSFLHHTQQGVLAAQHLQTLLLQDHTSQELLALMLPATPTTATTTTTTTTTTASTTKTTNDTTTTDSTTSTNKTTTTDTTASTTITTSLDQAQDRLSQLSQDLNHMKQLMNLMQVTTQLIMVTDTTDTIITTLLNQAKDGLSETSLELDHMEQFLRVLMVRTKQLTTADTTLSTIIATYLKPVKDRLSQLSLRLDYIEQLVEVLQQKTRQITTITDTTASTTITTSMYQAQDRLLKLSLRVDHMKQLVEVCKGKTDQVTTPADTTASTTITLDHCLPVLMHAAASLAAEEDLSEGRAKVLAELLQQCRHCPWLNVVQSTACCPTLAREVRPRLGGLWQVTGPTVQAAAVLAAIRVPAIIMITLHDNPDDLPHLMPLLQCLAKTYVCVGLGNYYSFHSTQPLRPCDSLLLPLCDPASLCQLEEFSGVLTAEGCRTLRQQQHNIERLHVGVLESAALEELLQLTYNTDRLQDMIISLYSIFANRPSKSVSPGVGVHLRLPQLDYKEIKSAVALARCISRTFKSIMLDTASPSIVCNMVRAFRKEMVRTPSLCREIWININNKRIVYWIHHFPLPLPTGMALTDVYMIWNSFLNAGYRGGEDTSLSSRAQHWYQHSSRYAGQLWWYWE